MQIHSSKYQIRLSQDCNIFSIFSKKESIQIFGCLILVSLFGSALFFPVEEKQKYHLAANEEGKSVKPSEEESEKNEENSKWKKNPIVKMFILTKWSLVKDPHFILTVLGSAYSFNALLTFLFYLPLYASTIDLSLENEEDSSCRKVNTVNLQILRPKFSCTISHNAKVSTIQDCNIQESTVL